MSGALILSVTMLGVSAANYLLNLLLARFLSPAEFGDANLAVNLVLVAAAAAATLQLLSARSGAINDPMAIEARRRLTRWAWAIGGAAGAGLTLGSASLTQMFTASTPFIFIVIGAGLPVYFSQAVRRGALQGDLQWGRLAMSYAAEAAARIAIAVVMLALGFGVIAAAAAITISFVASAIVAHHRVATWPSDRDGSVAADPKRPALATVTAAATVLLVGQVVIANGDIVLAKAVMPPDAAGTYAAAATIGRGLYFLSWAVVHSTFPIVARAESAADRRRALLRALATVVATCVTGVAGLALLGERLVPLLLGDGYSEAAEVLVPYAMATTLFAIANLVATLDLATGRWRAPAALLAGAALQTLLLLAFGTTPMSMATAQVVAMSLTAALVGTAHLCDNRDDLRSSQPVQHPTSTETDEMTATARAVRTAVAQSPGDDSAQTPHQRRSVLFLGTHGQANVGDELLLDTFLTQLGTDHTYAVNSYDPAATTAQLAGRFDVTVFDTGSDRLGLLRNLLRCDVVVFGGGNILKELYRSVGRWKYSTLVMVLGVVLLARVASKPVLMANVGIGPVPSPAGKVLVRAILRLVWLISVRDEGSFRFAVSAGCPAHKLRLVPDAVWVRDPDVLRGPHSAPRVSDSPLRIGVNLNKDVDVADEWDRFLDRLVVALNEVADTLPVEFHALPMQCGFKSGTDLQVLQGVFGQLKAPVHIHAPADHHEVASIIAACDVVVSERLHAVILSVVLGCPVIALPYDIKVRELARQLGIEERSFDVSGDLEPHALAAAILHAADEPGRERDRIAAVAASKRHDAAAGFDALSAWIAAPTRRWALPTA